jgi:hypothetical protein
MKRALLLPFTVVALAAVIIALLLASNLYTFYRLSDETPIAELRFQPTGEREYQATLSYGDFCTSQQYTLHGDQWRLDARFLKWRPWANLLGFDSLYRIERLGGRYHDIHRENTEPQLAYELHPGDGIDLVAVMANYTGGFSPVDTLYGSSVYGEMDAAYVYRVYRSQSGLLVRKLMPPQTLDAGGVLTIEIERACANEPGMFEKAARFTGHLLRRITAGEEGASRAGGEPAGRLGN